MLVRHTRNTELTSSRRKASTTLCCSRSQLKTQRRPRVGCTQAFVVITFVGPCRRDARLLALPLAFALPPNTSELAGAGSCETLKLQQQSQKKSTSQPSVARRKINTANNAVDAKTDGRPSSRRRRPAELRRRLATGRKTKPVRRGQALRPRAGAFVTLLPIEPVSHNDAAARCWFSRGRVR